MSTSLRPLVSIVVPIYNVEIYLKECFDSLISQTYDNLEIILVNDGSTDSSGRIADELTATDPRVKIIHKKNGGLSDARNAGMKYARGKYITFVDSDDYVDKNFIKNILEISEETNSDITQCNNSRNPIKLGTGQNRHTVLSGQTAFVKLMKFKTISPTAWGKLYKLSLFRDNSIQFPVGRIHEDTAVLYKLVYLANKIACMNKTLYFYRVNTNSIMNSSYTNKHYGSVQKYHEELDDFILKNNVIIDERIIYRHSALRILSVLNKLALQENNDPGTYNNFKQKYTILSIESRSFVCLIGVVPVYIPRIFYVIRGATPLIRDMLGKT